MQQGDQALAAFERKALLADIAGVEVLFQTLGGRQHAQDAQPFLVVDGGDALRAFQPLLQPPALARVGDVQVFDADAAAVDPLAQRDDVAQLHAGRGDQRAGVELAVEVGRVEIVESRVQVGHRWGVGLPEGVQLRVLVAAQAVGGDQLDDAGFLPVRPLNVIPGGGRQAAQLTEFFLDVQAALLAAGRRLGPGAQRGEHLRPLPGDAVRILQPVLVPGLDPGGIAAGQVRRGVKFLQAAFHQRQVPGMRIETGCSRRPAESSIIPFR